jgi:hypothetical protein
VVIELPELPEDKLEILKPVLGEVGFKHTGTLVIDTANFPADLPPGELFHVRQHCFDFTLSKILHPALFKSVSGELALQKEFPGFATAFKAMGKRDLAEFEGIQAQLVRLHNILEKLTAQGLIFNATLAVQANAKNQPIVRLVLNQFARHP